MDDQEDNYLQKIIIPVRPSRRLFCALGLLHLLVLVSFLTFDIGNNVWPASVLWALSLVLHGYQYIHQRLPLNARALHLDDGERWWLETSSGEFKKIELLANSFVHPQLIVLGFRHGQCRLYFPLLADSSDAHALRRLRIRLRYPYQA